MLKYIRDDDDRKVYLLQFTQPDIRVSHSEHSELAPRDPQFWHRAPVSRGTPKDKIRVIRSKIGSPQPNQREDQFDDYPVDQIFARSGRNAFFLRWEDGTTDWVQR